MGLAEKNHVNIKCSLNVVLRKLGESLNHVTEWCITGIPALFSSSVFCLFSDNKLKRFLLSRLFSHSMFLLEVFLYFSCWTKTEKLDDYEHLWNENSTHKKTPLYLHLHCLHNNQRFSFFNTLSWLNKYLWQTKSHEKNYSLTVSVFNTLNPKFRSIWKAAV